MCIQRLGTPGSLSVSRSDRTPWQATTKDSHSLGTGCFLPCSCKMLPPSFAKLLIPAVVGGGGQHAGSTPAPRGLLPLVLPGQNITCSLMCNLRMWPLCASVSEAKGFVLSRRNDSFIAVKEVAAVLRLCTVPESSRSASCRSCGTARGFRPRV